MHGETLSTIFSVVAEEFSLIVTFLLYVANSLKGVYVIHHRIIWLVGSVHKVCFFHNF